MINNLRCLLIKKRPRTSMCSKSRTAATAVTFTCIEALKGSFFRKWLRFFSGFLPQMIIEFQLLLLQCRSVQDPGFFYNRFFMKISLLTGGNIVGQASCLFSIYELSSRRMYTSLRTCERPKIFPSEPATSNHPEAHARPFLIISISQFQSSILPCPLHI